MRLSSKLVAVLCLSLVGAGGAVAARSQPKQEQTVSATTFVVRGRGWGHGIGMGQWGAYGMALQGAAYDKVLAYYYRGTELGKSPVAGVRVLLWEGKSRFAVTSDVPFRVRDGTGALHELQPGRFVAGPDLALALDPTQPAAPLPGPLTFLPGGAPLVAGRAATAGHPYRGSIQLQVVENRLQAVNVLGLEPYVRGVVSQEVPDDWPLEAVKAQAVAARSYALAERQSRNILYSDTRSQVYGGVDAETPAGNEAVAETRRQVLTYQGKVATTYFFSSSGGRTVSFTDAFPGANPVPYLVSVKDPYDAVSPYHTWGPVVLGGAKVSKLLGLAGVSDLRTVPANGHARDVVVSARDGETTLTGRAVRSALDLRSTWFRAGVLSLSRPVGAVASGSPVTLSGVVRRTAGPVVLEQREAGGTWEPGPQLTLGTDGTFSLSISPTVTTLYRLVADKIHSTPLRVLVASARSLSVETHSSTPASAFAGSTTAFVPTDPLVPQQWYLSQIRAFDFWPELPLLPAVKVAVIDTGIDLDHPEFADRIAAAKSFVSPSVDDHIGHGTFVAGLIAAAVDNGQGIAGIAFPAKLIIAKVSRDGTVDPSVEARAIRWAADRGARVINLSFGGVRDPLRPSRDTFSAAEADAVAYARTRGAVVVAAVGNGDQAPAEPWSYASYPAALPHVIGVSALAPDGSVPSFSNRDRLFNDLAAPGEDIVSTLPRSLTSDRPSCVDQGYSPCGPEEYQNGSGTSFATAQVSAAAALLFAVHPELTPDQVAAVIERSAADVNAASGCSACPAGRDIYSGWGSLDIAAALDAAAGKLPVADDFEANDDAGTRATTIWHLPTTIRATLDFWDDQIDVYRIRLRQGDLATMRLGGPSGTGAIIALWRPRTQHVVGRSPDILRQRVTQSSGAGPNARLAYAVQSGGWYYVEVKLARPGSGAYSLRIANTG